MIRRPPRSTLSSSSAASDVYKRQRLHELHDLIEQYKVEESKRRMANNQVIQDLQAGALWEEIGKQMGGLTRELNEFREEVQAQVQDITASLDKVSDAAGEARSLLEEDLQLEEERRDREAKSELAQRGEALHGVVEQIKGEIKQMKATADSQIQFSTDSMLETVDAQMTEAQSSARENQEQLQQQQTETEQILREFGHKIRTVGQSTSSSRQVLDDVVMEGNEGVKEIRRKLRDLELSSLRPAQMEHDVAEEEQQVAVYRESISRLGFEIDKLIEERTEEQADQDAKKKDQKNFNSHWLGAGEPLVDAAATLIEELESQAQMHRLKLVETDIKGKESNVTKHNQALVPAASSNKPKLQNQVRILEEQCSLLRDQLAGPSRSPSTQGNLTESMSEALSLGTTERRTLQNDAVKNGVERLQIESGIDCLASRMDQLEQNLRIAESGYELQLRFNELDKDHNGTLAGEEEVMELSLWLCSLPGFTSTGAEVDASTTMFTHIDDHMKAKKISALDFPMFLELVQDVIKSGNMAKPR
eukprot:TRINITY_DN18541_c0_g1_i2.p1 TRINITY_DN18541_c0_g1~~TRINITY_DN18541_c0_g1_i2.p1  ORF type:complete len:533 (+),score=182.47 TRINITY_DN18541_c0_g1_i2:155-1753(+)